MQADVQSQNIVGFQQVAISNKTWALYIPTFKGINNTLAMKDIVVCNASGVEFDDDPNGSGQCRGGIVKVYKMNLSTGLLTSEMGYNSTGYADREGRAKGRWGWGTNEEETLSDGEGLVVRNGAEYDIKFQISGEVELAPQVTVDSKTWGIIGNNTPVSRKMKDFMVCNDKGVEFDDDPNGSGQCRGGVVKVYKMNIETGLLANEMGYNSTGYADREGRAKGRWGWGANEEVNVLASEALVVRNGSDNDVIIKVKGPLAD